MRYYDVAFFQGDDFDEVERVADVEGYDAAIEYMAQWDFGDETRSAAEVNGWVHESRSAALRNYMAWQIHTGVGDYVAAIDHRYGHAALLAPYEGGE